MRPWKNASIVVALAMSAWGCGMAEIKVFQPKPLDNLKEVPATDDSKKLDAEVTAFLRNQYAIASARYYQAPGEIPWIAISKSVQNQMAEKSIQRTMFDWYEPGIDFVEVYPEGKNAFAVAMPTGTKSNADKLVGFYILSANAAAKK
ncbi:MAG TPA: hypothetical protein VKU19_08320 [Bryobacteraceae bacterium]|nr:hypothetical protein [Bryobacteraceae bacterium]